MLIEDVLTEFKRTHLEHIEDIVITDGYEGGEFLVEGEDKIKMELGDIIVLNGGKVSHGVSRVTKGYRASFNIWLTENVNKNII